MMEIPSRKENKCPVCGHEQPIRREFGDPEECDQCGHLTQPKKYDVDWVTAR